MFSVKKISKKKIIFQSLNLLKGNFFNFFLSSSNELKIKDDLKYILNGKDVPFFILKQIHSNDIITLGSKNILNFKTEGDGILSDRRNVLIGVKGADCYPLLIADYRSGFFSAIHCGWRGVAKGIVRKGIEIIRERSGSSPETLHAVIGMGICEGCYEIKGDVLKYFKVCGETVPFFDELEGKLYFNLSKTIYNELISCGISNDNIDVLSLCTKCSYNFLPSYRRNKSRDRIFAFIGKVD